LGGQNREGGQRNRSGWTCAGREVGEENVWKGGGRGGFSPGEKRPGWGGGDPGAARGAIKEKRTKIVKRAMDRGRGRGRVDSSVVVGNRGGRQKYVRSRLVPGPSEGYEKKNSRKT